LRGSRRCRRAEIHRAGGGQRNNKGRQEFSHCRTRISLAPPTPIRKMKRASA
jgi:hypothetical protein